MTDELAVSGIEKRLGARVRDLRTANGWSQEELAKAMAGFRHSMHQTTIAKIESGQRPVKLTEAVALSWILNVDLDALVAPEARSEELAAAQHRAMMASGAVKAARRAAQDAAAIVVRADDELREAEAEARAASDHLAKVMQTEAKKAKKRG